MVPLQYRLWGKGKAGVVGVGGTATVGDAGQLAGAAHGRGAPTCIRQLSVGVPVEVTFWEHCWIQCWGCYWIPVGFAVGAAVGVSVGVAGWLMFGATLGLIG